MPKLRTRFSDTHWKRDPSLLNSLKTKQLQGCLTSACHLPLRMELLTLREDLFITETLFKTLLIWISMGGNMRWNSLQTGAYLR